MKKCLLYSSVIAALSFAVLACKNRSTEGGQDKRAASTKVERPAPIDVWAAEKSPSGRLALLLRRGRLRADILQVAAPARFNELGLKLKDAARANPGAWLNQVLQSKPGEPLPYDPKFGVTEAEYKEFLGLVGQMVLQKTGEADLAITVAPEGVYTITGLPNVPELQVDATKMIVKVAQGSVSQPEEVTPNEHQKLTGPHNGYSWRSGVLGFLGGSTIKVFVGQVVDSKQVLIEVRIKDLDKDRYVADYLVRFPGPCK